jgi:hypothetical protein
MTASKDTPAFPRIRNHVDTFGSLNIEHDGLTQRQYYKAAALTGMSIRNAGEFSADDRKSGYDKAVAKYYSDMAALIADEMLSEDEAYSARERP